MSEGRGGLCCGGVRSRAADLAGLEMGRPSAGAAGLFRSPRYGRVRATASGASSSRHSRPASPIRGTEACFCNLGLVVRDDVSSSNNQLPLDSV